MAGTIPGFLACIPAHDTLQMRADRRKRMQRSVVIAISCNFFQAVPQQTALAGLNFLDRVRGTRREVVAKLRRDIRVLDDVICQHSWLQRFARGIV